MQLDSWGIYTWPTFICSREAAQNVAATLRYLGTVASGDFDEFGRAVGRTAWCSTDPKIGIEWGWTETLDGVFSLSDPMSIMSNIAFVDEAGIRIPQALTTTHLNLITHALPWQAGVSRSMRKR